MFKQFVEFFSKLNERGSRVTANWLSVFNLGRERSGFGGYELVPTNKKHYGSPVFALRVKEGKSWKTPMNTIKNKKIAKNIDDNYNKWLEKNKQRLETLSNG